MVTESAPNLIADRAQSRAVSPMPSTITCPWRLNNFYLFFDSFVFSHTLGRYVLEENTLG
jgi:hypothetical protein